MEPTSEILRAHQYYKACLALSSKNMTDTRALKIGKEAASIYISNARLTDSRLDKQEYRKRANELLKICEKMKQAIKKAIDTVVKKTGGDFLGHGGGVRCPRTLNHQCYLIYFQYGKDLEKLSTRDPMYLTAAKKALVIAAQNINNFIKTLDDQHKINEFKKAFLEILQKAQSLNANIKMHPEKELMLAVYDKAERIIIEAGSVIGVSTYEIWCPSSGIVNAHELHFFCDPEGILELSPSQAKVFERWRRPGQIYLPSSDIQVSGDISGFQVEQHSVGDCSVVSSLACLAHYEMRTGYQDRVISSKIFPQDNHGNPIKNPAGRYIVKLFVNGVWRRVEIDDLFPTTSSNRMISASSKRKRLWISLLEKAYLKVHGGYNFMGSNSCKDIYAFTGWLPERIKLKETDLPRAFQKISKGLKFNHCVVTIGTGFIEDQDKVGLVSSHAYGVFEALEYKGYQLLLVKNPWAHFSWKGRFSVHDEVSWTKQLKQTFHYDALKNKDNGMFWIDWESVHQNFDYLYISWKASDLKSTTLFDYWKKQSVGHDSVSLLNNPQYSLRFPPGLAGRIWVVFTFVKQPASQMYIALHAYESARSFGRKTIENRKAIKRNYYTNERVQIMKLEINPDQGTSDFNLVVSADQESKEDLYFSVRVFSSIPSFDFIKAEHSYREQRQIVVSEDNGGGGNPTSAQFHKNPQYAFQINPKSLMPVEKGKVYPAFITYESASDETAVGIFVVEGVLPGDEKYSTLKHDQIVNRRLDSKVFKYMPGFSYCEVAIDSSKRYTLIISTMETGDIMQGKLTFEGEKPFQVAKLKDQASQMHSYALIVSLGDFKGSFTTAETGGAFTSPYYTQNPIFAIKPKLSSEVRIRMQTISEENHEGVMIKEPGKFVVGVNASLFRVEFAYPPAPGSINLSGISKPLLTTYKGVYTNSQGSLCSERKKLEAGKTYLVIASTHEMNQFLEFKVTLYSSGPVQFMKYIH